VASGGSGERPAWDGDSQPPASSTGSRERPPWESGSQPAVQASGAQVSYPWESDARTQAESTGAQQATGTGPRPSFTPTGTHARPAGGTGSHGPVSSSGSYARPEREAAPQPSFTPTGTHPVPAAPWESDDWGRASDWQTVIAAGEEDVPVTPAVAADAEPSSGSGTQPVVSPSAKPERHSHRGGKHGKPSRWRGSGNRSNGDGDS
jgi:hypothetical protein